MNIRALVTAAVLMVSANLALADVRFTEARISQVESSDIGIIVFLQVISGDAPPTGNGGTNEPLTKSYLMLANSNEDANARKHLYAAALVALAQGTVVRFRWEDAGPNPSRITHILVRS